MIFSHHMDIVGRITLKHCLPLYELFYLWIIKLTLFALKLSLIQQTDIRALIEGLWKSQGE